MNASHVTSRRIFQVNNKDAVIPDWMFGSSFFATLGDFCDASETFLFF